MSQARIAISALLIALVSVGTARTDHHEGENKLVFCYLASWALNRPGEAQFTIGHIDPHLCTHLVYTSVEISAANLLQSADPQLDLDENGGRDVFRELALLKRQYPDLKVLLSCVGNQDQATKMSQMASNAHNRQMFAKSSANLLRKYGFDGLELNLRFPKPGDKMKIVSLLKDLRAVFKDNLLLAGYLTSVKSTIDEEYDIPEISAYLDYVFVWSFSYFGSWDKSVGPFAPLSSKTNNPVATVEYTIDYLLKLGVPANKMVMGIGSYGQTYILRQPTELEQVMGAQTEDNGFKGPLLGDTFVGYNEVCKMLGERGSSWVEIWHDASSTPYAVNGEQVMTYENERSIQLKAKLLLKRRLAGAVFWKLDTDDFRGSCGITYPLLRHLHSVLMADGNLVVSVVVQSHEYGK